MSVRGLCFSFAGRRGAADVEVFRDLDLSVRDAECVGIVGPSGCGKTTLLKVIGGLIEPGEPGVQVSGSVLVSGMPPGEARERRLFGFGFQNPVLLPWRTVQRNVILPFELDGEVTETQKERAASVLELVGVADFSGAHPYELSGGMQQRVNIARAIVHEPPVLLLDEPFGSLDEVTRERLDFALRGIQSVTGQTILFVTHSLSEAVLVSDRVVVLSERPARLAAEVSIDLAQDRIEGVQTLPRFMELVEEVKMELFGRSAAA